MDRPSVCKENRRHPRVPINLPLNFRMIHNPNVGPGFVLNASEAGVLIQTFKDMPIGTRIDIEVLFPKGVAFADFRAVAAIVWKDTYLWEDWEGYQYGLKFIQILDEDHIKLKLFLNNQSN